MDYRAFLLAEVVGSRQAWEDRPDQVPAWLGSCSAAFREAVLAHDGHEFSLAGDQLGAAFESPEQAVTAAIDAQGRLIRFSLNGSSELSVRMAVHAGEAHLLDGRFVGPALSLGLDLLKAARVSQILVSSTVARGSVTLPPGASFRDRGTIWLVEASTTEHVYDVVHPDLPSNFPMGQATESRESILDLHIPRDRRVALALGQALPDRTSGAVLFADMSKFSSLTESLLDTMGPQRGAEELTNRLNAVLTTVVREVHRYGGSVIGFAGDGVTCWFDGDNGRRATAAALATQHTLGTSPGELVRGAESPQVKIVVTAGLARRFLVGVPRIQRFDVLAGGILDRMAAAEKLARPGDVLIGSEIVGWIRDQIEVVDWRHASAESAAADSESFAVVAGAPTDIAQPVEQLKVPALADDVARGWINPVLFQRIASGEGEFVSELRQAVTLFVRFTGIQYDFDNDAGTKLTDYIEWVQKTLIPLGGFIMQVIVGDKGSYLYTVFGAPLAQEDDALRALRAAEKLMEIPLSLDFIKNTGAGISQGKMHAGVFGRSDHRTYEVLGHAANVAAGLMQRADPGRVLVSASVAEAGLPHYKFRPVGSEPIFELAGHERSAPALVPKGMVHTDIVGRAEERRRLHAYLDELLKGRTQMVVIQGPSGIGKSRLLVDLKEQAEALAIPTFAGSGNAIDARIPLYVWKDIFADVLGVRASHSEQAVRLALKRHLATAPQLLELAPLLNPVLPITLPDNKQTARIPPDVRSDNALNVMIGALLRPVGTLAVMLIIIDDAQWLDSASWTLVEAALRQHPSLLIAVATRSPESEDDVTAVRLPGPLQAFMEGRPEALLTIEPLGDNDVVELIKRYIDVEEVPAELSSVILERAEGNPFFAQELVGNLVQRGLVVVDNGGCRLTGRPDQLAAAFPERVEKLLISRLDHLDPEHRTTLLVASVLGRSFDLRMLADVHPSQPDQETLRAQMDDLAAFGLVALEHELPEVSYRFRHGLTHQAAGELLPSKLRGEIQAEAAAWIEANQAANLSQYYPTLARYWDAAGDVTKTLGFLELAAEDAWAAGAYQEAISFYSRAIDLARDGRHVSREKAAVWRLRLGEIYVHHQSEDVTKGRENLEAGLTTLGLAPPRSSFGLGIGVIWQLLVQLWHRMRGPKRSQAAGSADRLLEGSRAYERLVEVHYISGENLPSLYASLRALNLAEAAGPSPELTRGWATAGALFGFVPLRGLASRYLERSLRSSESGDPAAAAWASLVAGFYYSGVAEWDKAQALMEKVVAISGQVGDGRRLEDGLSNLMIQSYLRGDIPRGLQLTEELHARAVARHADRPLAYYLQGRAYCLLGLGLAEEARQVIDQLEDVQGRDQRSADQALINDTYGLLAQSELRRGNLRKALAAAEMLLTRVSKQLPSNYSTIAAYAAPAEVYADAWRLAPFDREMQRQMKKALRMLKRYARVFPIGGPRLLLWQGIYEDLRGRPQRARKNLDLSLEEAVKLGMRLEEMRALTELARLLGESDPVARDYRSRADRIRAEISVRSTTHAA